MAHQAHIHHVSPTSMPPIRRVSEKAPWQWFAAGFQDYAKAPALSLGYGAVVSLVLSALFLILQSLNAFFLSASLMAGFLFVGPVLAVGLFEVSRRIGEGKSVTVSDCVRGWSRNSGSVMAMGVILVLMMMTWIMLSVQFVAILYGATADISTFMGAKDWSGFLLSIQWPVIVGFGTVGLLTAAVAYMMTVIALPMLIDHEDMDVISAVNASVQAVRKNVGVMSLWAVILAGFTFIGVVPMFLGLIVIYPMLAYASWHAYRDLTKE